MLVDPVRGGGDPGVVGPGGSAEADVAWALARRLAARLDAGGAVASLSRGPRRNPTPSARARLANELRVDLVVSIAVNAHPTPAARGAASYYYGSPTFTSEPGQRLAGRLQDALVDDGWSPDCGVHPMTWAVLKETLMPAAVVEPGFLTSPRDEAVLTDPVRQDRLTAALVRGLEAFLVDALSPLSPLGPPADPPVDPRPVATAARIA